MRKLIAGFLFALTAMSAPASAEIDGHGPDSWRVVGVSRNDALNARMGPGTRYAVIERFRSNEGGLKQVTCVPYIPPAHFQRMSEAQRRALPPRWCLMQDRALIRAGWVNANYLRPDFGQPAKPQKPAKRVSVEPGGDLIARSEGLVRALYELRSLEDQGIRTELYTRTGAGRFFQKAIVQRFISGAAGADPIYGAQDFDGACEEPRRHPTQPMYRGMITVIVDCVNFGRAQRTEYALRIDPDQPDGTPRIFRISHKDWDFP
ncbi:hypothetical protein JYP46_19045 [Nitratireductor aquimarinus]|uniref:hypothetical protein n=1 Tax=Alphaproteobacteria TaxID=28211 RepID=UPI0019D39E0B|nr:MULTISPECIES: hypothetical protein [Alphaproteobacteria]MBN7758929.1 hypothetical protein [Nitratireductor aquimarinus]MBY6001930.1 hypothetical protein [Tritonibacter mobilis]MBY6024215.1 hypothetical protein [Nitratireductor sp. DP7N14-4]